MSLPWVLAQEIVRASREGGSFFLTKIGMLDEESPQYAGALARLRELYREQGVSFSGWASGIFTLNVLLIVFNLIPFFGSDGYRMVETLIKGESWVRFLLHRIFVVASIGVAVFFLLGILGNYIVTWLLFKSLLD
jgi:Zn-dependent protease